ncbi:UNVERIFIED_CONTAM: hypothetical protein NCL1_11916 [Trichonephila clavipes]
MSHAYDQQCLLSRKLTNTCQFDTKIPVPFKVLSHWWIDFDVGGSTFHFVCTRRRTRVTDLNSVNQSTPCTFCSDVYLCSNEVSVQRLSAAIARTSSRSD